MCACRVKDAGFPSGANGLPAEFLFELAAVCQLKVWEQAGLGEYLQTELPTSEVASLELHRRATEFSREPDVFANNRLSRAVMQVWLEKFAWAGPTLLQADFLVGETDEDVLVEALAQLAWDHRHDKSEEAQH